MRRRHMVVDIERGVGCVVLLSMLALYSCATSSLTEQYDTGAKRDVLAKQYYEIRCSPPSPEDPVLKFQLLRVEEYRAEKEVQTNKKEISGPDDLAKFILLPVFIGVGILSVGQVNAYDTMQTETVLSSEKEYVGDDSKMSERKSIPLSGEKFKLIYFYLKQKEEFDIETDRTGVAGVNVARLARSVTMDPHADEFVQFTVLCPSEYNCRHSVKIRSDEFRKIYRKLSEDGKYN